ncbi:hypothetical protein B0H17DRAFT_1129816 [Mycena rosella]|uniref:Uncharacterized protein n=1 Tax=Mycena rosella TaxID=1033263 RepID=A0AAD7DSX1_MYCRO|nr:hypothetical protein B0H17DRAFT_1129816 [Mycena rosella]
MQLTSIFTALCLAVSGTYAQTACATVPADVARQVTEMTTFNNRVPPPSTTSSTDCLTGKNLKAGIDAYRNALVANPASGCLGVYATTILTNGKFNPAYTVLGKMKLWKNPSPVENLLWCQGFRTAFNLGVLVEKFELEITSLGRELRKGTRKCEIRTALETKLTGVFATEALAISTQMRLWGNSNLENWAYRVLRDRNLSHLERLSEKSNFGK